MRLRCPASTDPRAALALARETGVPLADARALLAAARVLPLDLDASAAERLEAALRPAGVPCERVEVPPQKARCETHPRLTPDAACETCGQIVCVLCVGPSGAPACASCAGKAKRSSVWKARRVAVLSLVLLGVGGAAALQHRRRARRVSWKRPVQVAVVLQSETPLGELELMLWRAGVADVQAWFTEEARRHGLALEAPIRLVLIEPPRVAARPVRPAPTGDALEDTRAAVQFRRELVALAPSQGDVRLIVALGTSAAPASAQVEGVAEAGGDLGLVYATTRDRDLSLELVALAHELLHCLGALDAYDEQGHARVPEGLADPLLDPRFPQAHAEVMAGELPLAPSSGRVPKGLAEVRLGPTTARAIGWLR